MENKKVTTQELLKELVEFSGYGPLCPVFLVEAIRYYAALVSSTPIPEEDLTKLIDPRAWHSIAAAIHDRITSNFEGGPKEL